MKNKLIINSTGQIYVACPANVATGGPELLHQLVYELNHLGLNAFMYYYNLEKGSPIHENYVKYNNPFVYKVDDQNNNIIIVPEIKTSILYDCVNMQKVIWWLSVDNYYKIFISANRIKKLLKLVLFKLKLFERYTYRFKKNDNIIHFVQSEYARQHLLAKGIEDIYYLGDYLNELFIEKQFKNSNYKKQNIVIYNPKKGMDFTQKIINFAKDVKFVPIENMTRDKVLNLLSKAKVYIDFGKHPGKDRIPRESSISGCCVIMNNQGSAKYIEDVPVFKEFKFDNTDENIEKIVSKIYDCFENYEENSQKFEEHRKMIINEQDNFVNDIKNIFID